LAITLSRRHREWYSLTGRPFFGKLCEWKEAPAMPESMDIPQASVVIPTYNRSDELRKTLETMTEQDIDPSRFEVIVADDGSSDDTVDVMKSFAGRLRLKYYFQADEGFRAGAARNGGARLAAAPILIFLDSGTLAGPGLVSAHLAVHAASEERCAVFGYCYGYDAFRDEVWMPDGFDTLRPAETVERYREHELFADIRELVYARFGSDAMKWPLPWLYFFTMNCSMPVEDFWAAGGFDEMFRSWGVEDIELGYRLYRNGSTMIMSRDAWTLEVPAERPVKRLIYSLMRNGRQFLDKSREPYIEVLQDAYLSIRLATVMDEALELEQWMLRVRELDVEAEIEAAAAGLAAGTRLVIFGCGPSVPRSLPSSALLDFDADLLARATVDGTHAGHHAIGLRTALPTKSADVVIVTSRLSGLWDRYGSQIMREAGRVGRRVVVTTRP
jgi:glycosyltransferase involved in cell wall biosynthesis